MASTNVKIGYGTTIRMGRITVVSDVETITYTKLTGVAAIDFPDVTRADIDVTWFESPDQTEEFIAGMRAAGDLSFDKHYVQGHAEDVLLLALEESNEVCILEVTPPGGTAVLWSCYVKSYTAMLSVSEAQKAKVTLRVMGKVVP